MTRAVRVTVLGGGSWGTTVASLAAANAETLLWARDSDVADEINTEHRNARYLEDRALPESLRATSDLAEAAEFADVLVVGVPSQSIRGVLAGGRAAPAPVDPGAVARQGPRGRVAQARRRRSSARSCPAIRSA